MDILLSSMFVLIFASLEVGVISRIPLENGMADIMLLFVITWSLNPQAKRYYVPVLFAAGVMTFISSVPIPGILMSYVLAAGLTRFLVNRLWEMPVFSMLIVTIVATILQHVIYILIMQFQGSAVPFLTSLREITLPSIFLNIIFSFPIFLLVRDAQKMVFKEVENE